MEHKLKIPGIKKNKPCDCWKYLSPRKRPGSFSFHFTTNKIIKVTWLIKEVGVLNQSINGVELDPVDINIVTFYIDMNQRRNARYKER